MTEPVPFEASNAAEEAVLIEPYTYITQVNVNGRLQWFSSCLFVLAFLCFSVFTLLLLLRHSLCLDLPLFSLLHSFFLSTGAWQGHPEQADSCVQRMAAHPRGKACPRQ